MIIITSIRTRKMNTPQSGPLASWNFNSWEIIFDLEFDLVWTDAFLRVLMETTYFQSSSQFHEIIDINYIFIHIYSSMSKDIRVSRYIYRQKLGELVCSSICVYIGYPCTRCFVYRVHKTECNLQESRRRWGLDPARWHRTLNFRHLAVVYWIDQSVTFTLISL